MDADEALWFIEDLIRAAQERPLNDLQRVIFRGAWIGKDYKEIHQECPQVGLDHLMRNVGPRLWKQLSRVVSEQGGEKIELRKEALQEPIERVRARLAASQLSNERAVNFPFLETELHVFPGTLGFEWHSRSVNQGQDWVQVPAASQFQGRSQELETLYQWIEEDGCRLVALVGTAGVGKTDLSVKLAERLRDRFEWVVWRSLDSAITGHEPPTLSELLTDLLILFTGSSSSANLPNFIDCLRHQRCLIVLDGFESIMQSKVLSGEYLPAYENYSDLIKRVSDTHHQSCLILTSREKPREIEAREGEQAPVRSSLITGLAPEAVQNLFFAVGNFLANEADWQSLTHRYDGNPRFLQQVATAITNAFSRDVSRFLAYKQDEAIFVGDIQHSLEQQIGRLSYPEVTLIQQLARYSKPATLEEMQGFAQILPSHPLFEALLSLVRRSLIVSSPFAYTLNPVLREYLLDNVHLPQRLELFGDSLVSLSVQHSNAEDSDISSNQEHDQTTNVNINYSINLEYLEFQDIVWQIETAETSNFFELAKLLKRNPLTDYAGADLSETDLSGGALQKANFLGTDLSQANLSNSDLRESILVDADLSGADLSGADLSGADLSGADLSGAKVDGAKFGYGLGLTDDEKSRLKSQGAIFIQ